MKILGQKDETESLEPVDWIDTIADTQDDTRRKLLQAITAFLVSEEEPEEWTDWPYIGETKVLNHLCDVYENEWSHIKTLVDEYSVYWKELRLPDSLEEVTNNGLSEKWCYYHEHISDSPRSSKITHYPFHQPSQ